MQAFSQTIFWHAVFIYKRFQAFIGFIHSRPGKNREQTKEDLQISGVGGKSQKAPTLIVGRKLDGKS